MDLTDVIYETSEHIATITLNRPDRLNALGGSLGRDLETAFKEARRDRDVRVIILTGAGRAFCSGLDLKERSQSGHPRSASRWLRGLELPRLMLNVNKPVIAAVHGPAVGFGFELAMLCDYRIGSEEARMGDIHVQLGVIQDNAAALTLPRITGWANACKILLTGELFPAKELHQMGVLNEVVAADQLQQAARDFAGRMARNAPLAVQMTKRLMRMSLRAEIDDAVDFSYLLMGILQQTEDWTEGFSARVERRQPEFKGR